MEGPGGEKNYKTGSAQFLSTLAFIQINLHEKEERCKVVIQQALPMQAHIFLQESHKAKWAFMNYFSTCIMLTTISKCLGIRAPKLGFWPPSSPYEQWLPCKQRHSFSAAEKVHFPRDSSSSLHPPGFTPPPSLALNTLILPQTPKPRSRRKSDLPLCIGLFPGCLYLSTARPNMQHQWPPTFFLRQSVSRSAPTDLICFFLSPIFPFSCFTVSVDGNSQQAADCLLLCLTIFLWSCCRCTPLCSFQRTYRTCGAPCWCSACFSCRSPIHGPSCLQGALQWGSCQLRNCSCL